MAPLMNQALTLSNDRKKDSAAVPLHRPPEGKIYESIFLNIQIPPLLF